MPRPRFTVASDLRLQTRAGGIGNPRWMQLLECIDDARSITAAAKAAGLSYKAAWDAVDSLNNLAGRPVVVTAVGGKGGGGAKLTAEGRKLLTAYRAVEAENSRFLSSLNARLGTGGHRSLQTLGRLALRTSARNQWSGKVDRVVRGAVNDEVRLRLPGGERITAVITHESVEGLGLAAGREAMALVKSSSVMIARTGGRKLQISARNQLAGTITRLVPGAVNSEVVVGLRGGATVAAIVTNGAAQDLGLAVGQKVTALFKASAVVIGVA